AMAISLRPHSARPTSATMKSSTALGLVAFGFSVDAFLAVIDIDNLLTGVSASRTRSVSLAAGEIRIATNPYLANMIDESGGEGQREVLRQKNRGQKNRSR